MLINKKVTVLFIIFLTVIFLLPGLVSAQATDVFGTNDLANAGVNLGTKDLKQMIGGIVNVLLGFLGILATLIILYGGYIWMTSRGNAEQVDKAKRILINGLIGLVIVLSSYAIARFILKEGYNGIFGTGGGSSGGGFSTGAGLGAGALDSHYPIRYAKDVPRNTNIYLTFKEPMNAATLVDDSSCVAAILPMVICEARAGAMELYKQGDSTPITGNGLMVSYSENTTTGFRTFQINPASDLGSNTANVRYRMELSGLETQNGSEAFPYDPANSYDWVFTTGTEFDYTPPKVTSVRPIAGSTDNPRNSVVQINFSEPINPGLATGFTPAFQNIRIIDNDNGGPTLVEGEYKISNQYRTIELITDVFCGVNSCGGDVFCLPASDLATPDNFAALVDGTGTVLAGDVIADMSDNVLDGDDDDIAGGDYTWEFGTTNEIDLTPPVISSMQTANNISLTDPIDTTFDKELMGSSVNSSNIFLAGASGPTNYWLRLLGGNIISIRHDKFYPSSSYYPEITSGVKDLRQNCWQPSVCYDPIGFSCESNMDGSALCGTGERCVGI